MPTIVEYTDWRSPEDHYPRRIISPTRPSRCCNVGLETLGTPQREASRWVYQYRRCKHCGFAVHEILHEIPTAALVAGLRSRLMRSYVRNWHHY